ncbi:unnamed protein product [Orchesella dallaii]|uniref:CCHC-type domain-containing protein n=1 Tax=Orchesella dallaii TaxID=48710 RepID=A0ABP1R6Q8_9HEXA
MVKSEIGSIPVVQLDGYNYKQWRFQICLVLQASDIWDVVSGDEAKPDASKAAELASWKKNDVKARAIMAATLTAEQTNHIVSSTTAQEMFEKLRSIHSDSSTLNQQHTMHKFFSYELDERSSPLVAYREIEELARSLEEMGVKMDESMVISKIVSCLSNEKYGAFKKAWDSVSEDRQTMPSLLARLKKEELEHQIMYSSGDATEFDSYGVAYTTHMQQPRKYGGYSSYNNRYNEGQYQDTNNNRQAYGYSRLAELKQRTKCRNCDESGHWYKECPHPRYDGGGGSNYEDSNSNSDIWISDSGASQHVTGRNDWFTEYTAFNKPHPVCLCNGEEIMAKGTGTVSIECFENGRWRNGTITNVLYIPGSVNLFSEYCMAKKGYKIVRDKYKTRYYHSDTNIGPEAVVKNDMYVMKFRQKKQMQQRGLFCMATTTTTHANIDRRKDESSQHCIEKKNDESTAASSRKKVGTWMRREKIEGRKITNEASQAETKPQPPSQTVRRKKRRRSKHPASPTQYKQKQHAGEFVDDSIQMKEGYTARMETQRLFPCNFHMAHGKKTYMVRYPQACSCKFKTWKDRLFKADS